MFDTRKNNLYIFYSPFYIIFSLCLSSGCFRTDSDWGYARWSDDQTSVSRVKHRFESKKRITRNDERNYKTEIWRGTTTHLEQSDMIISELNGRTAELYDMGSASYLISIREIMPKHTLEADPEDISIQIDKIDLDGNLTELGNANTVYPILYSSSIDTLSIIFIPSPNAEYILKAEAIAMEEISPWGCRKSF